MKRILSILMENEAGALSRIVGLFSQRGYNIDSLSVAPTDDPSLSRLSITTSSDARVLEQITKQVHKLIDVITIVDLTEREHIEQALLLVKVAATSANVRDEIKRTTDIFNGKVVDISAKIYTVQVVGDSQKLDAFLKALSHVTELIEVVRSGTVAIARGDQALTA